MLPCSLHTITRGSAGLPSSERNQRELVVRRQRLADKSATKAAAEDTVGARYTSPVLHLELNAHQSWIGRTLQPQLDLIYTPEEQA